MNANREALAKLEDRVEQRLAYAASSSVALMVFTARATRSELRLRALEQAVRTITNHGG